MNKLDEWKIERDQCWREAVERAEGVRASLGNIEGASNVEEILESAADDLFSAWQSAKRAELLDLVIESIEG